MTTNSHEALKLQGDRMDNAQINASARFWQVCESQELAEHPHLRPPKRPLLVGVLDSNERLRRATLIAMVGRRILRLMFGVLLRELSRHPEFFTQAVAALANGAVREVGEQLQPFPFEERVRAFNGLTAQLAAGLQIALAEAPADGDLTS
ncbi:MAG TPA: hypothetical protein VFW13_12925 [Phenylobacterium sp.]|nr:hypothetical protein [Phenylobacterium sp.]